MGNKLDAAAGSRHPLVRPHVRYLHGFGSGPRTAKGLALGDRLAGAYASYAIPDLEGGDFTGLTMPAMRTRVLASCPTEGPVVLIGSSLGAYLAAWIAADRQVHNLAALVLIAPAFGFVRRWDELLGAENLAAWRRAGQRNFFHHARQREIPLGVAFLESCQGLPERPGAPGVPTVVIHGRQDAIADPRQSLRWADEQESVELHLVAGDHQLMEERHLRLMADCARELCERLARPA